MRVQTDPLLAEAEALARMDAKYQPKVKIPTPAEFRLWLRTERLKCDPKLSMRELSFLANCSESAVYRLEHGDCMPTLELAQRLWFVVRSCRRTEGMSFRDRRIMKGWARITL